MPMYRKPTRTPRTDGSSGKLWAAWNMAELTMHRLDKIIAKWNEVYNLACMDPSQVPALYAVTRTWFNAISPLLLIFFAHDSFSEKAEQWGKRLGVTNLWELRNLFDAVAEMIDRGDVDVAHKTLEELAVFFRAVMQEFHILYLIEYAPPRPGVEYTLVQQYGSAFERALEDVQKRWKGVTKK